MGTRKKIKVGQVWKCSFGTGGLKKLILAGLDPDLYDKEHYIYYLVEQKQSQGKWGLRVLADSRNRPIGPNLHWRKTEEIYKYEFISQNKTAFEILFSGN